MFASFASKPKTNSHEHEARREVQRDALSESVTAYSYHLKPYIFTLKYAYT